MKIITIKAFLSLSTLLILLFATTFSGYGQSVWIEEPEGDTEIGIDFRIPSFDGFNTEGAAFATYLYSHIPLSNEFTLQLDLPVSHFSNGGGESNFAVGNPYVGIQRRNQTGDFRIDFGVRLPLAPETSVALTSGLITENYKRAAFFSNVFALVSNVHYWYNGESGLIVRLGGGPEALFVEEGNDGELFVKYYGQLLYGMDDFKFGGGLTGLALVTAESGSFSDRTIHNLGLVGSYDFEKVTTGAYLEFPLDDDVSNFLNFVVGVNLAVSI